MTADDLRYRNVGLLGVAMGLHLRHDPTAARPAVERILGLLAAGRLSQRVNGLPLADAAEAHRRLEAREVRGRIALTS